MSTTKEKTNVKGAVDGTLNKCREYRHRIKRVTEPKSMKKVWFTKISSVPRTVPGTWPAFNKYFFNETMN